MLREEQFPLAILRTSHQLKQEGEETFYKYLKIDIKYDYLLFLEDSLNWCVRLRHLRLSLVLLDFLKQETPICEWKYLSYIIRTKHHSLQTLELSLLVNNMGLFYLPRLVNNDEASRFGLSCKSTAP